MLTAAWAELTAACACSDGCLVLYLVDGKEHLAFAYVLAFVNVYFGDKSGDLGTDSDVGFASDDGGIVGVEVFRSCVYGLYLNGRNLLGHSLLWEHEPTEAVRRKAAPRPKTVMARMCILWVFIYIIIM